MNRIPFDGMAIRLEVEDMETVLQIFLLATGFAMLIKGADFFVDGSSAACGGAYHCCHRNKRS